MLRGEELLEGLSLGRRIGRRSSLEWAWSPAPRLQEMTQEALTHPHVHPGGGEQEGGRLLGAGGVTRLELLELLQGVAQAQPLGLVELVQVAHGELQYVRLLQLGDVLALRLQRHRHNVLQLVQAGVDAGPPLPLQQRLGDLLVAHGLGDGGVLQ